MKPSFAIEPYVGLGTMTFGMLSAEIAEMVGPPDLVSQSRNGDLEEYRVGLKVVYASGAASEFVLMPPARALYRERDLLGMLDPFEILKVEEPTPISFAGTTIFLSLGIALTGFSEPNDSDSSVTVFERGKWDSVIAALGPGER